MLWGPFKVPQVLTLGPPVQECTTWPGMAALLHQQSPSRESIYRISFLPWVSPGIAAGLGMGALQVQRLTSWTGDSAVGRGPEAAS